MRHLLLSLSCMAAMTASAQVQKMQMDKSMTSYRSNLLQATAVLDDSKEAKAPHKSAQLGVYYKTPEGSMWATVPQPFYTYNNPYLVVAPWTEMMFENKSRRKNGKWTIETDAQTIDINEIADEMNNLWYSYYGGQGGYYGITYTEGRVSYIPTTDKGEKCINYIDDVTFHTFLPTNVSPQFYGMGSLDNKNLYGTGKLVYEDGTEGTSIGITLANPKPMSPLYVEGMALWAINTDPDQSFLGDNELTAFIYNLDDPDAEPVELTCTADEVKFDSESDGWEFYMINFTQKVYDEASGEFVAEPFIIDYPSQVEIYGFDKEGVNIDIPGMEIPAEFLADIPEGEKLNNLNQAFFLIQIDGTDQMYRHYYTNCVPVLGFYSMFDICEVQIDGMDDKGNHVGPLNGIAVSEDGATCTNCYFGGNKGAFVMTAVDWKDEKTGEEFYWSDDMYDYDWILELSATFNEELRVYEVSVVCDALPAGVDSRYAVIHINGRGATSQPIYVLQGDITIEEAMELEGDAIVEVSAPAVFSNKTFNVAGQQVGSDYKGIVISNGKKYVQK